MEEIVEGIVYKIEYKHDPTIRYIGSTTTSIEERWKYHNKDYSKYRKGTHGTVSIYPYFKEYGIDNFFIEPIKTYQVCDESHLHTYETLWIRKLKGVNKYMPFSITYLYRKQYYEENKEQLSLKNKQYREEHKEQISEQRKQYREENKEQIRLKNKQYREEHKEELKQYYEDNKEEILLRQQQHYEENKERLILYQQQYREKHKEQISEKKRQHYEANKQKISEKQKEKVECKVCHCFIRKDNMRRHERTKKHQDNFHNQNTNL